MLDLTNYEFIASLLILLQFLAELFWQILAFESSARILNFRKFTIKPLGHNRSRQIFEQFLGRASQERFSMTS